MSFPRAGCGKSPVRFDEREQETGSSQTGLRRAMRKHPNSHREAKATAPVLDSTPDCTHHRINERYGLYINRYRTIRIPVVAVSDIGK